MAKDYAKFIPPKQRSQPKSKGSAYFFVFLLALVLLGSMGGYLLITKQPVLAKSVAFLTHKKPLSIAAKITPPVATVKEPEVQFDFYSELPNMQVTFTEPGNVVKGLTQLNAPLKAADAKAADVKTALLKTDATIKPEDIDQLPELNSTVPVTLATAKQPVIFNTDELKTLLDAETHATGSGAQQYVIQLGVFESEAAATRLLAAINAAGFDGNVVKSPGGFRVQQGPYASRELAKLTQQRLQKRGIISIIRKTA